MTVIRAQSDIDAPLSRVWDVLVDIPRYAEWNPFTPRIDTTLEVGSPVVLHVQMKPTGARIVQTEYVRVVEKEHELSWGMTMGAPFVLRALRRQVLTPLSETRTRYETSDAFHGLLVPVVMGLYRVHIQRGFDDVARALKARCEA
ncbi:MAG: SRPBCC domain-containing protein [Kofleriaceae bacterium]|nr:SRPBCC domain-containing protein [Kofleriaceae bacterium]